MPYHAQHLTNHDRPQRPALPRRQKIKVGGKGCLTGLVLIKMNLRRKSPADSLYLLLDTLCNAFGGIILLAVLVVLLTSKEKSQSATASDSQEMLQRRLALAETNLQLSLQLAASLNTKANIIVRYGHIYPCRNSDLSRNETDINWTSTVNNEIAEPIQGKGLEPNAVASYFSGLSSDEVYVVFCVYEDSFPAFIRAKQSTVASGVAYGWEPFRGQDGPVSFGENGHIPKAQ